MKGTFSLLSIRPWLLAMALALCTATKYARAQQTKADRLSPIVESLQLQHVGDNWGGGLEDIRAVLQDQLGFIWVGTSTGLYRYDGVRTFAFYNTPQNYSMLANNKVMCLAEDGYFLWVGTESGLTRINLRTYESRTYHFDDYGNCDCVGQLLINRSGTLWVGTEGGLYRYDADRDEFVFLCDQRDNSRVPHCAIKALLEDHKGNLWVGTWDRGLYRYQPATDTWYEMPRFNDKQSAHALCEDSAHRLWVGTWGKGLYCIENPQATNEALQFTNYMTKDSPGLDADHIYSLHADMRTGVMWIGHTRGISLYDGHFLSLPMNRQLGPYFMSRGADVEAIDRQGNLWINAHLQGLVVASVRPRSFSTTFLPSDMRSNGVVRTLFYDHTGQLWLGVDNYGVAHVNSDGSLLPAISNNTIYAITEDARHHILAGSERQGILDYDPATGQATAHNMENTPWLRDDCVFSFANDPQGKLFVGTWRGLCVRYANGKGVWLEGDSLEVLMDARVRHIQRAQDGSLWLSTLNQGLLHLTGDFHNPSSLRLRQYTHLLGSDYKCREFGPILIDSQQRLWVCSGELGLLRFDAEADGLRAMNSRFGIPYHNIYGIEQDSTGNFWLSTRTCIMRLTISADSATATLRFYANSVYDDVYNMNRSSASLNGRWVTFGAVDSWVSILPDVEQGILTAQHPLITDLRIFNTPLAQFSDRESVSELLPPFTSQVTLSQSQNDLTIGFSQFSYVNPRDDRFAYMLEGYESDWIFAEPYIHQVHYSNLPAGSYRFRLRAVGKSGQWQEMEQPLVVKVLPSLWLRWWAILIYIVLAALVGWLVARYLRDRERGRREIQQARFTAEKTEELNHKKLQFFTNITHDLMTPLTVISAVTNQLEREAPDHEEAYQILRNNLNKQMRMLQQILGFRKAQTGNLSLRVSETDVADFLRREVESIHPLMSKNKQHLSLLCVPENIVGYIDNDALDKIVYNLLSNAARYTPEMGSVQVEAEEQQLENGRWLRLTVKDTGHGIAKDKLPSLFQRFYDGEHRRFNTYGTGIGLSLTHDLTILHHGTIEVESEKEKGTTFIVLLPLDRSAYAEEEIDDLPSALAEGENAEVENPDEQVTVSEADKPTLLLVEDDEELLMLMEKLLHTDYCILKAHNGQEALDVLETQIPDLVVADVMMPVMDGMELSRQIKSTPKWQHLPLIMLTAKRDDDSRVEAYDAGADAYIVKPFNLDVLQSRIQNLVKRRKNVESEIKNKVFSVFGELNVTTADEDFLTRCITEVNRHLSDANFDQEQFADAIGASKSTLYKKLKQLTGKNTPTFIRTIRMKAACDILDKTPNIRISDLAYAVGYNDPKYFSTCFKKDFGVLPKEYAQKGNKT